MGNDSPEPGAFNTGWQELNRICVANESQCLGGESLLFFLEVYRLSSLLLPCHPHSASSMRFLITGINHPLVVLVVTHLLVLCVRTRTRKRADTGTAGGAAARALVLVGMQSQLV